MKKFALLLCLMGGFLSGFAQSKIVRLSGDWEMKSNADSNWQPAQVPGNVYLDLARNGHIQDPLTGIHEQKVRWVDSLEWQYRKAFKLSKMQLKAAHILLQFDGIDTEADIYLNGQKLGRANNMFRSWEYETKKLLRSGENVLILHFSPVIEIARKSIENAPLPLPGGDAPFIRKAQYQFGWDWAPRLLGCGIWKDVRLTLISAPRLNQPLLTIVELDSSQANIRLSGSIQLANNSNWEVETRLFDGKKWLSARQKKANSLHEVAYSIPIQIPQPELWWPNGHGQARLYPVEVNLYVDNKLVDQKHFKTGLRSLKWVQQPDSIGASFTLEVNGKPIFVKGANWVPPDQFPARISAEKYHQQVQMAAAAGLNMLRVWGGGTYADETFLDACDSLGILVWQDFMFACALYPGDKSFLTNVRLEASQQIERMRNRTSLALWCGNNEINEGWFNWHWQESMSYSLEDSLLLYRQYEKLFHQILPKLVADGHPGAFYHPSSPANGWGRDTAYKSGDVHYWGVWWGFEPFENYRLKTGRFVSEYGFQGYPNTETRELMVEGLSKDSALFGMSAHQKHPIGDSTIRIYMARDYPLPDDAGKFAYVSQLLQARGMQIAMESHRFAQPYCMGSLFWQWNDCWPAISWSAIDYLQQPKAFYYQVKRSWAPDLIRVDTTADSFVFQWVSDTHQLEKGTGIQIQLGSTKHNYLLKDTLIYFDEENFPIHSIRLTRSFLPKRVSKNEMYIRTVLLSEQIKTRWSAPFYLVPPKSLALVPTKINWVIQADSLLILDADMLVKDLEIIAPGFELENNYFDLLAGEKKTVRFRQKSANQTFKPQFRSLVDCF